MPNSLLFRTYVAVCAAAPRSMVGASCLTPAPLPINRGRSR
jgi:hypothetical protein